MEKVDKYNELRLNMKTSIEIYQELLKEQAITIKAGNFVRALELNERMDSYTVEDLNQLESE